MILAAVVFGALFAVVLGTSLGRWVLVAVVLFTAFELTLSPPDPMDQGPSVEEECERDYGKPVCVYNYATPD